MGHQVSKWVADDGTEFDEKKAMLLYEMAAIDAKEIDIFLTKRQVSQRRVAEYKKLLIDWQQYMRAEYGVVDENAPPIASSEWKPDGYAFDDELIEDDPFAGATHI